MNSIDAALLTLRPPALGLTVQEITSRFLVGHHPPVCLPSVYLMLPHMTRSPRPSPSVFAYCKRSILEVGTRLDSHMIVTQLHIIKCPAKIPNL